MLLVDAHQWRDMLSCAAQVLDRAEAARVARKRFERDRDLLTLAYATHRLWLAHSLDCDPAAVPLTRDARGAPQLPGTHLSTSLSHCGGAIAIALGAAGAVGVDIEPLARAAGMSELAKHICHPNEWRALARAPAHERDRALLRLWVRKEALLKAAGVGLRWDMAGFEAPCGAPIAFACGVDNDLHVIDIKNECQFIAALATAPEADVDWAWLGAALPLADVDGLS